MEVRGRPAGVRSLQGLNGTWQQVLHGLSPLSSPNILLFKNICVCVPVCMCGCMSVCVRARARESTRMHICMYYRTGAEVKGQGVAVCYLPCGSLGQHRLSSLCCNHLSQLSPVASPCL